VRIEDFARCFELQIGKNAFTERECTQFSLVFEQAQKHPVAISYLTPLVSPPELHSRCGDGIGATSDALCGV
jgi:hypothetical protein